MMFRLAPLLRCLAVLWFATAAAALAEQPTLGAARAALRAGAFLEAAELGKAQGSAEGLAFAAKALGYHARCVLDDRPAAQKPIFQRAYDLAETAVEQDPDDPEAWTQRARIYARLLNFDKASMSLDQATRVIERLDSYLNRANALAGTRAEPPMARGRVEIGKLVASRDLFLGVFSVFGDRDRAFRDFCTAVDRVEAHPAGQDRALVYYTVAEGLWKLDRDGYAALAAAYLDRALEPCGADAVCVCIQADAQALRRQIRTAFPSGPPPAEPICPAS